MTEHPQKCPWRSTRNHGAEDHSRAGPPIHPHLTSVGRLSPRALTAWLPLVLLMLTNSQTCSRCQTLGQLHSLRAILRIPENSMLREGFFLCPPLAGQMNTRRGKGLIDRPEPRKPCRPALDLTLRAQSKDFSYAESLFNRVSDPLLGRRSAYLFLSPFSDARPCCGPGSTQGASLHGPRSSRHSARRPASTAPTVPWQRRAPIKTSDKCT